MKIALAQMRSVAGDVIYNLTQHIKFIRLASDFGAGIIIFPELSLTGYEPTLAAKLACDPQTSELDILQTLSNELQITIAAGMPVRSSKGINIGMFVFQPAHERQLYCKKYLHPDEDQFFVAGDNLHDISVFGEDVALAICYELSIPEHTAEAMQNKPSVYIASVAKTANGIRQSFPILSATAKQFSSNVLFVNCVGEADGMMCAGHSSVWDVHGKIIGQLDGTTSGILFFDTDLQQASIHIVQ